MSKHEYLVWHFKKFKGDWRWPAILGALVACPTIVLIYEFVYAREWAYADYGHRYVWLVLCSSLFLLGLGLSFFVFRQPEKADIIARKRLPEGLLPLALLPLLLAYVTLIPATLSQVNWMLTAYKYFKHTTIWEPSWFVSPGDITDCLLRFTTVVSIIAGVLGLLRAKRLDRRWRAVYISGLTATMLCFLTLYTGWIASIQNDNPLRWCNFWAWQGAGITAVGLLFTCLSLR